MHQTTSTTWFPSLLLLVISTVNSDVTIIFSDVLTGGIILFDIFVVVLFMLCIKLYTLYSCISNTTLKNVYLYYNKR